MLKSRKTRIRLVAFAFGAATLLIPLSFSPGQETTLEVTEACAGSTCCPEIGSTCPLQDPEIINYYKAPDGCDGQEY